MASKITIEKLHLYKFNPRLPPSETEEVALFNIVDDQGNKLVELAKDIAEKGLNQLENIAVFPAEKSGHYCVAEGNRRIAALKLLNDPSLIKKHSPALFKAFQKIKPSPNVDLKSVSAIIFESENDPNLIHFIELRHLGEQGGIGTVKWDATQKARFDAKHTGGNPLLLFLDELKARGFLSESQLAGVTKTNWERILRRKGLAFLCAKKEAGYYIIPEDNLPEFTEKIRLIADALNGETVARVYSTKEIDFFLNEMQRAYETKSPDPEASIPAPIAKKNPSAQPSKQSVEPMQEEPIPDTSSNAPINSSPSAPVAAHVDPPVPRDLYSNCKTVIPRGLRIQSRKSRISQTIRELKSLEVQQYPNACGDLLRALIELSAKEYLEHNGFVEEGTKMQFGDAISSANRHLLDQGKIDKSYSSLINKTSHEDRSLFNGYMHNTDSYPDAVSIQSTFKTFETFIKYCLA